MTEIPNLFPLLEIRIWILPFDSFDLNFISEIQNPWPRPVL